MNTSTISQRRATSSSRHADSGFTLVEVLIVIVILGIVATVVVFAARGVVNEGEDAACRTEKRILQNSVEAYLGENITDAIPPTGDPTDANRFEQTLVAAGPLGEISRLYDVNADGTLAVVSANCA